MKVQIKLFAVAVLATVIFAGICIQASEVSDKFDKLIPDIGAADLSVRGKAQSEWQEFCLKSGNDSAKREEAVKLMVAQLQKTDTNGETVLALLSTLGLIGDSSVTPTIQKFLGKSNREIKFVDEAFGKEGRKLIEDEAVRALARIPGKASERALSSTNSIYARSGQIAHNKKRDLKIGAETKMPIAIPYASRSEVDKYLRNFDSNNDVVKTQIVVNLGIRGDGKYAKLIKDSIKSENVDLRRAAIAAIVKLNSGDIVEPLIDLLLGNDDASARAATSSLSTFADKQVDVKLVELAKSEKDAKRFNRISEVLTNRKTSAFLPVIFERLKSNTINAPDRRQVISRAKQIATAANIAEFIDLWLLVSDRGERADLEKIIAEFAKGDASAVISKQTPENKTSTYSLLGRIGDPKTLPEFRKALSEGSAEAFGGIREWPDATVASDLISIVKGDAAKYSAEDKVNALRSYIRVISLPQDKLKIKATVEEQANFLISAFELSTRDEERDLVIQRLGSVRHVKSLNFVVEQVSNEKLSATAIRSILSLSHHAELRRKDPDVFKSALKLVQAKANNKELINAATKYLENF
ncbi:MAG: hypothetical protein LBB88_06700 [Planctomycetaceae bacterium]|jgi:HEAT repeat protein|nr:hypothetical protein [Planctomycetaceae bacterium]